MSPTRTGPAGDATPASLQPSASALTRRRRWIGCGVAVLATSAAMAMRLALSPWTQDRPVLILFLLPIILSAYVGGLWPGVLATLITVAGTKFFMLSPLYSLRFEHSLDVVQWCLMLATGVLISVLSEALHRSRRRMEEAAQDARAAHELASRQERRFRALVERGHECVVLIDSQMHVIYATPSLTNVEGYAAEEVLGQLRLDQTHPDDQLYLHGIHERVLASPGIPVAMTWRRRHKDGRWLWMEGMATNLLDTPEVGAIVVNYRDITGRKNDESRIQAQLAHLDLLHRITRAISRRQDLGSILQVLAERLETQLPVDFGCVCLHDQAAGVMKVAHVGDKSRELAPQAGLDEGRQIPLEGLALCMRGVLVYEPETASRASELHRTLAAAGLHSAVIAPLLVDKAVLGMLLVARRGANRFAAAECDFLTQLSDHVALAALHSQEYDSLRQAYAHLHPQNVP